MTASRNLAPKPLTSNSTLTVLLRTLYRLVLDYCAVTTEDGRSTLLFTKDQLVALIERNSSEATVGDIPKLVQQGIFRPLSPEEAADAEHFQALVVEEESSSVLPVKEALMPRGPDYPEWWKAPVPFALLDRGRLYVNPTAVLMFGAELKRLSSCEFPDKSEFLVELENTGTFRSLMFRRLEPNLFVLEDVTEDISSAEEITWWAAVGKAWAAALDSEGRPYRRSEKVPEADTDGMVLSCEWNGQIMGYFCIGEREKEEPKAPRDRETSRKPAAPDKKDGEKTKKRNARKKAAPAGPVSSASGAAERDALSALGPQAMGLLVPGTDFFAGAEEPEKMVDEIPSPASAKKGVSGRRGGSGGK